MFLTQRVDDGRQAALKIGGTADDLIYEYHSLSDMAGLAMVPGVVELDEWHEYTFLVLEYIEGCDLGRYIQDHKCSYAAVARLGHILVLLMKEIWCRGYCLTDIKPENIMVDNARQRIVIIDWSSLVKSNEPVREFTPAYDIASWNVGRRLADQRYVVFAISMLMTVLINGKSYSPVDASINDAINDVRYVKCPPDAKNAIIGGLRGKYDTLRQFCNAISSLDMYNQLPEDYRINKIINIILVAAALFAFLSIANWIMLI